MSDIKILLVDDREDNLTSIEAIFSADDYDFVKANSGKEALKILLKEQDFNLILMDVKMPGLSGFETASLIYEREKLRQIPIIFITAHSYSDEIIYEGYKTGAVDYIYKPIKPQLLKAKVSVFIDLYRKTEELRRQEINLKNEIAERKLSEEQVKKLNEQLLDNIHTLENANAELARFAYVASHDLQEPLRKIQTYGDLLNKKYSPQLSGDGQHYIERMQKAAKRLQKLIKDVLTYSRLTDATAFFTKADINAIINDILVDLELRIEESGATIYVDDLPELFVNPGQISQLFQNLISNALKFARKDVTPEIRITYTISNKAGDHAANGQEYCNISVQDNGIGFDESYMEQIFTLFKRLNDTSEYEGTGIGLAICKKIVEQHKGFISAKSKINEGSTFIISLPISSTSTEEDENRSSEQIAESINS